MSNRKSVIFGLSGTELGTEESAFFRKTTPAGFILFARNIDNPAQVRNLNQSLRECAGWHCPILIDQEGGRVARLAPPHWRQSPCAGIFAGLAENNLQQAGQAVYFNSRLIAAELFELDINVDCAPMADLLFPFSHDIIGDRSFGSDPQIVSELAGYMAKGLLDGGVLPVLKHIPGHGRAKSDSHKTLPVVDTELDKLTKTDFIPFINLNDLPIGMTAHVTYTAIDDYPATLSKKTIDVIRNGIGFDGLLLTDDISMKALGGSFSERTKQSLEAGCDVVLHCNGEMDEMKEIADSCPELTAKAKQRLENAMSLLKEPSPINEQETLSELENLLA